jgi:hypothetical protein
MKTADISNECRPMNVSELWLDRLMTEFFNQVNNNFKVIIYINVSLTKNDI